MASSRAKRLAYPSINSCSSWCTVRRMSDAALGRIRVCCRIRPLSKEDPGDEDPSKAPAWDVLDRATVAVRGARPNGHKGGNKARKQGLPNVDHNISRWGFTFDDVLREASSQEEVYDRAARGVVEGVLEGYNGTLLAYGCTGAGKTYTVTGGRDGGFHSRGVCARAISHVFKKAHSSSAERAISVQLSALEIYNEQMYDLLGAPDEDRPKLQPLRFRATPGLLGPPGGESGATPAASRAGTPLATPPAPPPDLAIYEHPDGSTYVKGLSMPAVAMEDEALSVLFEAETNRAIAEHQLNRASSRSHMVFTIHVTSRARGGRWGAGGGSAKGCSDPGSTATTTTTSKLNIVDLAGSENCVMTGSAGLLQKEAGYINKSLAFLEQVTIALADKARDHIPYRRSKLTHMLKDSLGGNCRTVMVACVWPRPDLLPQSLATLKFATRMRCVKNSPVVNTLQAEVGEDRAMVDRLLKQVQQLQKELARRDSTSTVERGRPVGFEQRQQLRADARRFALQGGLPPPGRPEPADHTTRDKSPGGQGAATSGGTEQDGGGGGSGGVGRSGVRGLPVFRTAAQANELLLALRDLVWAAAEGGEGGGGVNQRDGHEAARRAVGLAVKRCLSCDAAVATRTAHGAAAFLAHKAEAAPPARRGSAVPGEAGGERPVSPGLTSPSSQPGGEEAVEGADRRHGGAAGRRLEEVQKHEEAFAEFAASSDGRAVNEHLQACKAALRDGRGRIKALTAQINALKRDIDTAIGRLRAQRAAAVGEEEEERSREEEGQRQVQARSAGDASAGDAEGTGTGTQACANPERQPESPGSGPAGGAAMACSGSPASRRACSPGAGQEALGEGRLEEEALDPGSASLLSQLKSLKREYRYRFEQLRQAKEELGYLRHNKDKALAAMAGAFDGWRRSTSSSSSALAPLGGEVAPLQAPA